MRSRLTGSIAFRLLLLAVLQLFLVVVFFSLRVKFADAPFKQSAIRRVRFLADELVRVRGDRAAQIEELQRIHSDLRYSVAIYSARGERLAGFGTAEGLVPPKQPPAPGEVSVVGSGPPTYYARISNDPLEVFALVPPALGIPPGDYAVVAASLVMMFLTSGLFARSLLRPLQQLSSAAQQFGRGDLSARSGLQRRDELGQLSEKFDEMAARIQALVSGERELLANVSHELRTPLARIRVALDIASEGDADTARESLSGIAGDLVELEQLVDDVLATARLDPSRVGGVPPLRREGIGAEDVVRSAVDRFSSAHRDRRLEVALSAPLPQLSADRVLLRRALDNLLDNAGKYSEPHTPVALRAWTEGERLLVEVEDRGIGIDAHDLPRLFTPFFRTDRSRARKTGGVGLGLALAKRIVEAHGGTLSLVSQPGSGTTVRMALPSSG